MLSIGAAGYFYAQYAAIKKNPEKVAQDETKIIVDKVGKLLTLPKDEQPTLATILDKEKLKDQPFFNDATNGDKILIYTQAKKAIVYRESENRIINVGPILLNNDVAKINVGILKAGGDSQAVEKNLNDKFANSINIVAREDAKKRYKGITVVDTSGQKADTAKQLADTLGGTVGSLQSGETSISADIIVIVP